MKGVRTMNKTLWLSRVLYRHVQSVCAACSHENPLATQNIFYFFPGAGGDEWKTALDRHFWPAAARAECLDGVLVGGSPVSEMDRQMDRQMDRPAKEHEKCTECCYGCDKQLNCVLTPHKALPGPKLSSQFSNSQRTSKTIVGSPSVSHNKYLHICQYDTDVYDLLNIL